MFLHLCISMNSDFSHWIARVGCLRHVATYALDEWPSLKGSMSLACLSYRQNPAYRFLQSFNSMHKICTYIYINVTFRRGGGWCYLAKIKPPE